MTGLRVLLAVVEQGSFTAAAGRLGYTQSAVSRQVAVLEREAGVTLFDRGRGGSRLTAEGVIVARHARVVLDELAAAGRELTGARERSVHLGAFVSAGFALLPAALASLRRRHPDIRVTTREGTTPALVRSLRAGTLDLAVVTARPPFRAPDAESPRLVTERIGDVELVVAVPSDSRYAGRGEVGVAELATADWIASPGTAAEPLLGVWPGLPGRPRVAHAARDWLTKLQLVAAGCGVTTVTPDVAPLLPGGVDLVRVADAPPEVRRLVVVCQPGRPTPEVAAVVSALRSP
ncbi:DNA-binding transcriptional regulator, LysR family [Jatrophihabitans endophyticus]|uniref:DNA-binding transcriptional regulator, LysR family n=2 Tax=Jatrophihabitans endophyticus TaxID=1206085 RepID=A0A1M5SR53_9ACTN|nr:DNA-binding transcriptional regulator, LysR family [Jatrophihabitans endophyticus]